MTARLVDTPVLRTERFVLRAPRAQDYPAWEAFFLSDRAIYIGGGPEFDTGRAWRAFSALTGHWALHGFGTFVVEDATSGEPVGATGPWCPADWPEQEIGWTIWTAEQEGRGVMREAVPAVLSHVFGDLGWATAVSYIDRDNARSIVLAERLGATHDAKAVFPRDDHTLVYRHVRTGVAA